MKKRWKIFWIVCGSMFLAGIICCSVSWGMGTTLTDIARQFPHGIGWISEDEDWDDADEEAEEDIEDDQDEEDDQNERKQEETAAETLTTVNEAKAPMAEVPTTPAAANTAAKQTVISNEPVPPADKPKPKPKLNLVGKPPLPRQFMRTPQASDFISVSSEAGGYSMAVPKAFGKNPLADLPQAEGAMLVRTAGNILMLAATVLDPADTASFKATEALPVYENAKVYWQWQHGNQLIWTCRLSAHNDYHGNKLLLTAEAQQNGKTYQLLYVMPAAQADNYLPQALYSLDSFKLNQP